MFNMTSKIIDEDLAGPTLSLTEEDEQRLLEFDNEDTSPNDQSVRIWHLVLTLKNFGFQAVSIYFFDYLL